MIKLLFSLFIQLICLIICLLLGVAFFTLIERKLMSSTQRRQGPNVVGFFGLLQPIADGLKLFLKETILPTNSNVIIFIFAPIGTFMLSLLNWGVLPIGSSSFFVDLNLSLLYIFCISSLSVYGVIIAGWSSNSKFAFLGGLRSTAQLISYEISLSLMTLSVVICSGSLNLNEIVMAQKTCWFFFPFLPLFFIFFTSLLAETNRHPFDLPEAEAELVSGYNVEYSAIGFALFFLGEYGSIILISSLAVVLFFGGWYVPVFGGHALWFVLKTLFFIFLFIFARAAYPRYRYDQLIRLGWKVFLPVALGWLLLTSGILIGFNWLSF